MQSPCVNILWAHFILCPRPVQACRRRKEGMHLAHSVTDDTRYGIVRDYRVSASESQARVYLLPVRHDTRRDLLEARMISFHNHQQWPAVSKTEDIVGVDVTLQHILKKVFAFLKVGLYRASVSISDAWARSRPDVPCNIIHKA